MEVCVLRVLLVVSRIADLLLLLYGDVISFYFRAQLLHELCVIRIHYQWYHRHHCVQNAEASTVSVIFYFPANLLHDFH